MTRAATHPSHSGGPAAQAAGQPSQPVPPATDPTHEREPPHIQHGLYEYAQAQQRRVSPGGVEPTRKGRRSASDAEIDASNRRTAWTLSIVVVLFLLIAAQGHDVRALLRLFGWHLY